MHEVAKCCTFNQNVYVSLVTTRHEVENCRTRSCHVISGHQIRLFCNWPTRRSRDSLSVHKKIVYWQSHSLYIYWLKNTHWKSSKEAADSTSLSCDTRRGKPLTLAFDPRPSGVSQPPGGWTHFATIYIRTKMLIIHATCSLHIYFLKG